MNSILRAAFDVSRIMPLYCQLMNMDVPSEADSLPPALKAKMLAPELVHAWNPQKVLTEIEIFSLAVYEQTFLDDTLLDESFKAFKVFAQTMAKTSRRWYLGSGTHSYGDGEESWHFSVLDMKIGSIALQLCPRVVGESSVDRAKNLRSVEKCFETMMLALDTAPYIFSSGLEEYDEGDRTVWSLTASATASFLKVVRKVNAQLPGDNENGLG
jgi:hypothetical protein